MFTASFIHTRVTFATALALVTLAASLFIFQTPHAQAEVDASGKTETSVTKAMTASDLQMLIAKLQTQLRELTGSLTTTEPQFKPGMSVEVTDNLRIRGSASINGAFIGVQNRGVKGVVVEGPIRQGSYNWVKVDYESGPDGWNAAGWLKQRTEPSKPESTDTTFNATVSKLTATVSFTLSNGCGGYIISWGDDTKTEMAGSAAGRPCTMAIVNVTKDHAYAKAGTYKIKVERFNGQTRRDVSEKEIKVGSGGGTSNPGTGEGSSSTRSYTLADVTSVTKQFIDPSLAIADEEYTQYVITLKAGRKIEVKVYGRTVPGTTEEAFRKTGFTGDVSVLMSRARELSAVVGTPKPVATTTPIIINCKSGRETYTEGTKRMSIVNADGSQSVVSDGSYICKNKDGKGVWIIEGSLPKPATTTTYTNVDVQSITKQVVASPAGMADGGYTLYTITLKTGRKVEVKVFGLMLASMVEAEFKKTGYTGNIADILSRATAVTSPSQADCIKGQTGSTSATRPSTAECLGTSQPIPPVVLKSCTLKTTVYKHGESARFAQASGGSSRPSNGTLVNHVCQNGEWKPASSTSTQTGVGSSTPSTSRYGSVRGASTDIMSEISVTLTTIRTILADLK